MSKSLFAILIAILMISFVFASTTNDELYLDGEVEATPFTVESDSVIVRFKNAPTDISSGTLYDLTLDLSGMKLTSRDIYLGLGYSIFTAMSSSSGKQTFLHKLTDDNKLIVTRNFTDGGETSTGLSRYVEFKVFVEHGQNEMSMKLNYKSKKDSKEYPQVSGTIKPTPLFGGLTVDIIKPELYGPFDENREKANFKIEMKNIQDEIKANELYFITNQKEYPLFTKNATKDLKCTFGDVELVPQFQKAGILSFEMPEDFKTIPKGTTFTIDCKSDVILKFRSSFWRDSKIEAYFVAEHRLNKDTPGSIAVQVMEDFDKKSNGPSMTTIIIIVCAIIGAALLAAVVYLFISKKACFAPKAGTQNDPLLGDF